MSGSKLVSSSSSGVMRVGSNRIVGVLFLPLFLLDADSSVLSFVGLFFSLRILDVLNEGVILRTDNISDSCIADAD